jgi:alanine racemase
MNNLNSWIFASASFKSAFGVAKLPEATTLKPDGSDSKILALYFEGFAQRKAMYIDIKIKVS